MAGIVDNLMKLWTERISTFVDGYLPNPDKPELKIDDWRLKILGWTRLIKNMHSIITTGTFSARHIISEDPNVLIYSQITF